MNAHISRCTKRWRSNQCDASQQRLLLNVPTLVLVAFISTTYITDGFRPSAHGLLRKSVMGRAISRPQGPALIISDIRLPPYTLLVHGTDAMSLHD
ncbi:uncharacterized protein ARMOST_07482 [Armillaria ostoyae]|uniref:Uncharacterized protein n=1 Tax=Armillaria ostoyae TaxID=47428 RepID=A0A284R614_ARMOS|nr:uncharacterized protein ARMOST_07482 [Armillaria ostoyae]